MATSRTDDTPHVASRVQSTCACCGSTRLARARDYRCDDVAFAARVHPSLDVLRCRACGLAQVDHEHLDVRAHADWLALTRVARRGPRSKSSLRWLEARGRAIGELSRRFHGGGSVARVFQFGAGPGLDLVALQTVHRQAECWAEDLESDSGTASLARVGTLAEGPFDRILMTHVLGHAPDPVAFVRRATSALRPGGILIVEVGNDIDAFLDRRQSFEPQLTFFTIDSLPKLFSTNFGDDLDPMHLATAGPRVDEVGTLQEGGARNVLARLFGRGWNAPVDLPDDTEARDRAFVRAVYRRKRAAQDDGVR